MSTVIKRMRYALVGMAAAILSIMLLLIGGYIYFEFDALKSSYYSLNHSTEETIHNLLSNRNELNDNIHVHNVVTQFDRIYNGKNSKEKYLKEIWKGRKVPYEKITNEYGTIEIYNAIQTDYISMDEGYAFAEIIVKFGNTRSVIYFNYAARDDEFTLVRDNSITFFIHDNKHVHYIDYYDKGDIEYKIRVYNDVRYFLETQPVKDLVVVKRQSTTHDKSR